MRYNTIYIDDLSGEYIVRIIYNKEDRVDRGNTKPNKLGFYHCPANKPIEEGFLELKGLLIANHEEEIDRLKTSLNQLRQLEI